MRLNFFSISKDSHIIIFLVFFSFSNLSSVSQTHLKTPSNLIFVEGGEKRIYNSVEDNIKSFGLDHVNSMITAYNTKLEAIDTNDINNKIWIKRIKYELVLLRRRKQELTN